MLDSHDDIGIPPFEIHFFDRDDPLTHPDFFPGTPNFSSRDPFGAKNLQQYETAFEPFAKCTKVGEDSTTYLQSPSAPYRIGSIVPNVKMIFLLRDPVSRAYSQYWHLVSRSRATQSFEKSIVKHPWILLGSTYLDPLQRYFSTLGRDNVMVGLFEDFISDRQTFMDSVTDFIGVERFDSLPEDAWTNRTLYPSNLQMKLALNHVGRHIIGGQYDHLLNNELEGPTLRKRAYDVWQAKFSHRLMRVGARPPMASETREYLQRHLSARNHGLSDLLGRDLASVWKGFFG